MSPTIKIDQRTLEKVKKKQGLYSGVSVPETANHLKPLLTQLIQSAFMEYAMKGHKADRKIAELEWNRFNRFLQKKL